MMEAMARTTGGSLWLLLVVGCKYALRGSKSPRQDLLQKLGKSCALLGSASSLFGSFKMVLSSYLVLEVHLLHLLHPKPQSLFVISYICICPSVAWCSLYPCYHSCKGGHPVQMNFSLFTYFQSLSFSNPKDAWLCWYKIFMCSLIRSFFLRGVDMLDTRLIQVQKKKKNKNGSEKKTYTHGVAFVPAGRPLTDGNGAVRRSVGRSQGTSVPSSGAPHQQGASKSSSVSENLLRNSEKKANMNFWVTIGNILLSRPHKRRWLMQSRGYSSPGKAVYPKGSNIFFTISLHYGGKYTSNVCIAGSFLLLELSWIICLF